MFSKKIQLVTHDGTFHADDVFAAATLSMWLERQGKKYKISRSRDEGLFAKADYVFDVGATYDPEKGRFDHHQRGGAGQHESGIPYAAFGLIWKHFGLDLCDGNHDVWRAVEAKLVEPIDAIDTGVELVKEYTIKDRNPYSINAFFSNFRPTWKEEFSPDIGFFKLLPMARIIIEREIVKSTHWKEAYELVSDQLYKYNGSVGELDVPFERSLIIDTCAKNDTLDFLYVVYPTDDGKWRVVATREDPKSFVNRKNFPESWWGLRDEEMAQQTGVEGATFCHPAGFLCGALTREGAVALANKAIDAKVDA